MTELARAPEEVTQARYQLHLGNCLDAATGLASLGDHSVDHILCDPPYDEHTHQSARSLKDGGSDIPIDFAALADLRHVPEMLRVARRWVIAFCALEQLGDYKRAAGEAWVRAAVWHRTDGTPQISSDRPAQSAEGIAIMHAPGEKLRWNGRGARGHWSYGVVRSDRVHPTQKPVELMETLVRLFTDPGELICDPFAGGGSTGVAALKIGRRFVGWELDPKYHEAATHRLKHVPHQLELRGL